MEAYLGRATDALELGFFPVILTPVLNQSLMECKHEHELKSQVEAKAKARAKLRG